jgi:hypothetical protein
MDSVAAERLSVRLRDQKDILCKRVAARLIAAFPELEHMLLLEGDISAETRLSRVSVERLFELVRAVLVFESYDVLDNEFQWAVGVLPRRGVTYQHQSAMVRCFCDEVYRLRLEVDEFTLMRDIEHYILRLIRTLYADTETDG